MKYRLKPRSLLLPIIGGALVWGFSQNVPLGVATFAVLLMPAIIMLEVSYAKDNPQHFWFKRKLYGWGWTPVTWQGWLITLSYVALLAVFALTIERLSSAQEIFLTFGIPFLILTSIFIWAAYKKGEKPRWQWGRDENDD